MELYTLRYVLAVADSGNFSLAAQACHVGQPALSQQIAKLEKELGVALFARNPRGATLTEAGKDLFSGPGRSFSAPRPSRRRCPSMPGCARAPST